METHLRAPALHLILLAGSLAVPVTGQTTVYEEDHFYSVDGAWEDRFGWAVDLDGWTAVVSSPGDDPQGSVYVFERVGAVWTQRAKVLDPDDLGTSWSFGEVVAISGDTILVGGPRASLPDVWQGAAWIFVREGSSWIQQARLTPAHPRPVDEFGFSVDLDGDRAVVGAPRDDWGGVDDRGSAYVFERTETGWRETRRLFAHDAAADDEFGHAVAVSGDRVLVSSIEVDTGRGAVLVFERSSGPWAETDRLVHPTPSAFDRLGASIALDGDTACVGLPGGGVAGTIAFFEHAETGWEMVAEIPAQPPAHELDSHFGWAVDLDGSYAAAGAMFDSTVVGHHGATYLYERTAAGWVQAVKHLPGAPEVQGLVGKDVAVSGVRVISGAAEVDGAGPTTGSAYALAIQPDPVLRTYCPGDGTRAPCPCGNDSAVGAGEGCRNSTLAGARAEATGSAELHRDDLGVTVQNLPPGQPAILFGGTAATAQQFPFGDGHLCVGGEVVRLRVRFADSVGHAEWGPGILGEVAWGVGTTLFLQCWYRDPSGGPCGSGFNLSNGLEGVVYP